MRKKITLLILFTVLIPCSGLNAQERHPGIVNTLSEDNYNNHIDELVFAKLKKLGIPPSELCSDAVFVRRVYLDAIGTLPTPYEARRFLNDKNPDKRSLLIDRLLQRDEYADYWSMKWCDILRVKSEFPIKLWPNAVQAYYRWIKTALKENMPYNRFAYQLLTSSGSNFRVAPVNFYRAVPEKTPDKIAEMAALTFMGVRTKNWTENQRLGLAAFFAKVGYKGTAEWKEEIIYFDSNKEFLNPHTNKPQKPVLPDGESVSIPPDKDPRLVFADWLIRPDNTWFAQNIVNRIWYWLLGRGIIHEADDIRSDNPAQNPELLSWLEKELIDYEFDLKHIFRLILNSKTYQLSSEDIPENTNDGTNFSHYYVRRLDAEVLIDAICKLTGTTENYSSNIPEPFTFIPGNQRSITLADGSITSPFLDMFGRPPRDTGYESERNNNPAANQMLHLLNSSHIQKKIKNSWRLKQLLSRSKNENEALNMIYLSILSRLPSAKEREIARAYMASDELSRNDALFDLVWALINTKEFLFKH